VHLLPHDQWQQDHMCLTAWLHLIGAAIIHHHNRAVLIGTPDGRTSRLQTRQRLRCRMTIWVHANRDHGLLRLDSGQEGLTRTVLATVVSDLENLRRDRCSRAMISASTVLSISPEAGSAQPHDQSSPQRMRYSAPGQ